MFELRKIGIVKRASALLLDLILLAVLATGFMFIISLICNYSHEEELSTQYYNEWEDFRKEYVKDVAAYYGFVYEENDRDYTVTKDGQESSLGEIIEKLDASNGEDSETAQAYQKYLTLPPVAKVNAQYKYVYSILFMMISFGLLLSYLVLEFALPLILKNGQTVGKKVFGICLVKENCVKIKPIALFARTLLGKFAIETMFPVALIYMFLFGGGGILMLILIAALAILDIVLLFATRNKTPIHDMLAGTVVVDAKTQMIYASEEELIAAKTLQDKEEATAPEQAKELKRVETKNFIK